MAEIPESLAIIAGRGAYPGLLAESARRQGVRRLFAVGFLRETDRRLEARVDRMAWVRLGQLGALMDTLSNSGIRDVVMAGQIRPRHLFTIRFDRALREMLSRLSERNATTIFGALCDTLKDAGFRLHRASLFMESAMPDPGLLGRRPPDEREERDIALGLQVAKATSGLEIGQTVVVKEGTVIAVEAFEGTDAAVRRAGRLAGPGAVVVKAARRGHDMRFDIPVVGMHTMKSIARARVSALALEANRTIILERERVAATADRLGVALVSVSGGESAEAPAGPVPREDKTCP